MDILIVSGRMATEISEKVSEKTGKHYGTFRFASDIGYGENAHTNFRSILASAADTERMIKAKVKTGSSLELQLEEKYETGKNTDGSYYTRCRYRLLNWAYAPFGSKGTGTSENKAVTEQSTTTPAATAVQSADGVVELDENGDLPF